MLLRILTGLIAVLACGIPAQTVNLNGKVTDATGKTIGGAIIQLKSRQLVDTSDAAGNYSLGGIGTSSAGKNPLPGKGSVALVNGNLEVELIAPHRIRVERFDVQGNLVETLADASLPSGSHRFPVEGRAPDAGLSVVRVSIGDQSTRFLLASSSGAVEAAGSRTGRSASGKAAAKASALDDVLEASAVGFKPKSVPITSYEGKVDISLESNYTGTCTESKAANTTARGSGTHSVVVETNADAGIAEGTIFRPSDLAPGKMYPIVVWGQGACSKNGLSTSASMAELASHGYFVIADGTPNGTGSRPMNANNLEEMGRPMLAYITWAIAENRKPCSKYYQSLDTSKIGANGFSCGGLLSMGTAKDPRTTTWGLTSSGSFSNNPTLWNSVHTPVLIIEGHLDETGAYTNGLRDYNGIAPLGHPILFMSHKSQGHGGDLWSANGGDFTRIHLAWLNWWLKGDVGTTGKGRLVGSGCTYCTNSNWEVKSSNLP